MKLFKITFVLVLSLLFITSTTAEMKDKKFTPKEIRKMSETNAVIELYRNFLIGHR